MLAGVEALANGVDRMGPRSGRADEGEGAAAAAVVMVVVEGEEEWAEEEAVVMGRCKSAGKVGRGQRARRKQMERWRVVCV